MAMTFSFHENLELAGAENPFEISPAPVKTGDRREDFPKEIRLLNEKMSVPVFEDYLARPRLDELLEKTLLKFGAALITGRTGTGKTALAADFSRRYGRAAWFSVEAAENDWDVFFKYFEESFSRIAGEERRRRRPSARQKRRRADGEAAVAPCIENLLARVRLPAEEKPFLVVIDGIHHVFDAEWFSEFFATLLRALTPDAHLLMLSRSAPPVPLWRMRSKQILGVIDEKLLVFTLEETVELFEKFGLPAERASQAYGKTFGRISRLKEFIGRSGR
jgi:LuxR family maltose regulon positive regulatory protein